MRIALLRNDPAFLIRKLFVDRDTPAVPDLIAIFRAHGAVQRAGQYHYGELRSPDARPHTREKPRRQHHRFGVESCGVKRFVFGEMGPARKNDAESGQPGARQQRVSKAGIHPVRRVQGIGRLSLQKSVQVPAKNGCDVLVFDREFIKNLHLLFQHGLHPAARKER